MSSNLKVLVADDNRDHVQLITEILNQELKAEVEGVTKGEECLEKVKKTRYDLLLLDYLFPEISGLDVLKEIVEKGYDLPVIMITGHGSEKVAVEAMKAGAIDYIVKSEDGFQSLPFVAKKAIEKDQLRKRLRESEEKFKNLFESANDAIIYLDKSGRILEVNKQAVEVFGGSKEEVLGKHFTRLGVSAPRDIPTFMSNFANILAGKEVTQDVCIKNKKGQEIPLECSASLMKTDDKVSGVMVIARDITERKRAEEALRASEQRYRLLFERNLAAVYRTTLDGTVLDCNESFVRLLGYDSREEVMACCASEFYFDVADREGFIEKLRRQGALTNFEFRMRRKDGSPVWILENVSLIEEEQGASAYLQGTSIDITERKRAEEALKKSVQLLRDTGEMAKVGGWELDLSTQEVSWTEEVGRIHGVEPGYKPKLEEAINFYAPESIPALKATLRKTIETGEPYDLESLFIPRGSKNKIWVRSLGRAVYSGGKIVKLAGTFQNIDKYKRAEEALKESEEKFRTLAESAQCGITILQGEKTIYNNPAVTSYSGYTEEELNHMNFWDMVRPDFKELVKERGLSRQEGKPAPSRYEIPIITKNGEERWVDISTGTCELRGKPTVISTAFDITERKKAEEMLHFTRFALDNAVDTMVCISQDARHVDVNDAFCRAVGYSREELLSMTVHDIDPNYSAEIWPEFWEKLKRNGSLTFESCHRRKDGKVFPIEGTVTFFKYKGKEYHCGFGRDITERKKAEEKLRLSEEKFAKAFGVSPAAIYILSLKEGQFKEINKSGLRMLGYRREEIIGHTSKELNIWADYRDREAMIKKLNKKSSVRDLEVRMRRKSGEVFDALISVDVIDIEGERCLLSTASDVTARKRAEEEIHKLNQYLGSIIDNANVWLDVLDEKANVVFWNKAAEQISGFSREEVVGHGKIWEWLYPDERYRKEITTKAAAIIEKGEMVEDFETIIRCKNGEIKIISWHSRYLLGADGKPIGSIALGRDVTEKKKMEAQLIQSERLAAVGTLAYGIAHEFNNILAGILGNAEFGMGNDNPEEVNECFRIIMEGCDRAKSITNSLLVFSRQRETKKQRADVTSAVETILGLVERELEKHNIKVVRKFNPIPEIVCDLGELSGAVLNMITNARDAMRPKGGTLTIEIEKKGDNIEIIFTDTGCGIPDSIKSRIFEPFVTTKGALGQSEIPGTGLGLFLSYGIIKRYDGEIGVKSEVGKGSTFTIRIPISKNQTEPTPIETEKEKLTTLPKNLHILLVDDEKPICTAIKKFFEAKGHSVTTAISGKKGLTVFKKGGFDLVLADIVMPDMDGVELISKLKKIDKLVKFIVLTGHIGDEKLEKVKKAGADQILMKPFRNEELYQAIGKIFAI